jgi:DNA-binding IclR family transcriptional regulator
VSAFGVPIRNSQGAPVASISVVGITEKLPASRAAEVIETLEQEARVIGRDAAGWLGSAE